jgi:hypothetical protein
MARHKIIETTPEHLDHIVQNIRKPDLAELWASCLQTPDVVARKGLERSEVVMTGMIDDEPVCVWGVVKESMLFNAGTPWMIGSKALDRNATKFLRHCRPEVMKLLDNYDILENYVDARNRRSIQWLRWLGFNIEEAEPYGVFKLPFHRFWMEKAHV